MEAETSAICPQEIANGKPAIVIVDNDDFKIDTLIRSAKGVHRTNVLYLQPKNYAKKIDEKTPPKLTKKKLCTTKAEVKRSHTTSAVQVLSR